MSIFVMCNDVFDWATADVEKLTVENIDVFEKALCDVAALDGKSYEGPALFCARVRGRRPQKPYYRDMDTKIAALFDACGPERDD